MKDDERNIMKNFNDLGLSSVLNKSLAHMKYTTPTPIQAKAIPIALAGRDILGSAQTGTGKTAAFAIPLVEALLNDERKCALVMTPTRELGRQVMEIMHQLLGHKSGIKTAFLIGGESMSKQYAQLKRRPRLIVGTPGRINDHVERRNLHLDKTKFLVLDETDRMLDMGFSVQIDKIVKHLPNDRQTLLFSATMPKNIIKMADKYQNNPERIAIGSSINIADNIDQKIVKLNQDKKYDILMEELAERNGSVIIFVKTKRNADRLARKLNGDDHNADAIHGDLKQSKRARVIKAYRSKAFRILVATDVVSRGLDVPHVAHVINYDLPQVPEDYIHRIGRTARAGAKGESLCLISPQDGRKWHAIEQMLYPDRKPSKPANDGNKGRGRGKSSFRKKAHRGKSEDNADHREDRPYKGKRKFSDSKNNEGKPQKKRHFKDGKQNDRSESGNREDRPYKGRQTKRSRSFVEGEVGFNSEKRRDNSSSNKGRRSFSSGKAKPAHKNDGSQPRRVKRSSGNNNFSGGKNNRAA